MQLPSVRGVVPAIGVGATDFWNCLAFYELRFLVAAIGTITSRSDGRRV